MIPARKLQEILDRFAFIEAKMIEVSDPAEIARLGRDYSGLQPVVATIRDWQQAQADLAAAREILDDPDLRGLAEDEITAIEARLPALEELLRLALLPRDAADERAAILEIRPGTGGDEAALFAGDLWRMYLRFAEAQGWSVEILEENPAGLGGYREVVAAIRGKGVFARLKFESGVHRVQRIPVTEAGGRIHTSAATVAVLPEAEEIDVQIEDKDLRIDIFRASGPGGQSVNTTDSAVRITHLPTGIVVSQQDEKSQHKNKAKAMRVLRARIYQMEREKADAELADQRRSQVGTGNRAEKIRTYNFPQDRITDHRVGLTIHGMARILDGDIDELIDAVALDEQARLLKAAV